MKAPASDGVRAAAGRALAWSLALWGVGALSDEALASAGLVGTCVLVVLCRPFPISEVGSWARRWLPLLAFLLWAVGGPLLGAHAPTGSGVARWGDWLAIPLGALAWTRITTRQQRAVFAAVGATFLVSCVLAFLQHVGAWPGPEQFEGLRWTRVPFYRLYEPVPGAPGRFMAGGLLAHRLKFAHTGGLVVLTALALGLRAHGRQQVLCLGLATLGFVAVLEFPSARAAAAALLVSMMAVVVLSIRRRAVALAVAATVALAGVGVIGLRPSARERFLARASASGNGDRAALNRSGLAAARSAPLTGIGAGRFRVRDWASPDTPDYVRANKGKAHDQLLTIAAEEGLIGLALFVVMLVSLGIRIGRGPSAALGLAVLLHFLLLSLAHDPLFQAPYSMALALALSFATRGEPPIPAMPLAQR